MSERPARAARAMGGAAVSLAGVAVGIASLLWVTDDPSRTPPPVQAAVSDAVPPASASPQVTPPAVVALPTPVPAAAPPEAASPPVAAPVAAPAPGVVPVTVLNNSRIAGLADRGAREFEAGGWPVSATGSYRGRIRTTTVYYPAGLQRSAQEFAARFAGVARVLPRPENLPGSGLTVVLTRDFG